MDYYKVLSLFKNKALDHLARKTGFIKRKGRLKAKEFLVMLSIGRANMQHGGYG